MGISYIDFEITGKPYTNPSFKRRYDVDARGRPIKNRSTSLSHAPNSRASNFRETLREDPTEGLNLDPQGGAGHYTPERNERNNKF